MNKRYQSSSNRNSLNPSGIFKKAVKMKEARAYWVRFTFSGKGTKSKQETAS
jgi:hypothetical protein